MLQWIIRPFKGLGDLRFGDSRQVVHDLLGTNFVSFTNSPGATSKTELYDIPGFHLYYDMADGLELIEAFAPCDTMFNGIHLLNAERDLVFKQLAEMGYVARFDDGGYFFDSLGIAFYAPYDGIEAVSIYRQDYYSGESSG